VRRALPLAALLAGIVVLELLARGLRPFSPNEALFETLRAGKRPPQYVEASADPVLVYEPVKNLVHDGRRITDSHGLLRAREASIAKKPGVRRVAVLGDSVSANVSFKKGPAPVQWPAELERLLAGRAEVLNFAVDGYGTREEARRLETKVLPFSPDAIILQYCYNDPSLSIAPFAYFAPPRPRGWALVELLKSRLGDPEFEFSADKGPVLGDDASVRHWLRLYSEGGPLWARVREGFARIGELARRREIPVIVAVFPLLYDQGADKAVLARMRQLVVSEAYRNGFVVADLDEAFRKAGLINAPKPKWDVYHPDDAGQRLAARELLRALPFR
jgi:hypothetical protein